MDTKRIVLFFGLLLATTFPLQAFDTRDAEQIAKEFYRNLKIIAEEKYPEGTFTENSVNAIQKIQNLCYDYESTELPNEFVLFGFGQNAPFVQATSYISLMWQFATTHTIKITATVDHVESCEEIKSTKRENSRNFYDVYVKKKIEVFGMKTQTFEDIVRINAETSKITMIANETGGGHGESVIILRGKAAKLFEQKRFDEAFDTYLRVVALDPKQGDAYYRLGLMAYHKLGCKNRYTKGSIRREKALEFIEKAIQFGNYNISQYAENVKYYMINGGA